MKVIVHAKDMPSLLSLPEGATLARHSGDDEWVVGNSDLFSTGLPIGLEILVIPEKIGDKVARFVISRPVSPDSPEANIDHVLLGLEINKCTELRTRITLCLAAQNIQTLGDLLRISEQRLLRFPNMGPLLVKEVKEFLATKGLELKKE